MALGQVGDASGVRDLCRLLLFVAITEGHDEIIANLRLAYRKFNTAENGLGLYVEHTVIEVVEAKRQAGAASSHGPRRFPFDGAKVGHEIRGALGYFPGRLTGTGSL